MNLEQALKEEWEKTFQTSDRYTIGGRIVKRDNKRTVEIFRNPSSKDFKDAARGGEVRFLVSYPKKKVYIFEPDSFHYDAALELGLIPTQNEYLTSSDLLGGVGVKRNGKWTTLDMHSFTFGKHKKRMEVLKKNWKWADKYINVSDYLNRQRSQYRKGQFDEEWEDSFRYTQNGPKRTIEVFKNPTPKEMDEAGQFYKGKKYLRFIAADNNVYVFQPTVYHSDASYELKLIDGAFKPLDHYWGSAVKTKEGWKLEGSDMSSNSKFPKYAHKYIKPISKIARSVSPMRVGDFNLKEEWKDTIKLARRTPTMQHHFKDFDIFVNPTAKEMLEAAHNLELRYLASFKDKKVYVFSPDTIHQEIAQKLGIAKTEDYWYDTNLLGGIAKLESGKFKTTEIHNLDMLGKLENQLENIRKDWSWVDKYILTSDYLNNRKQSLEHQYKIRNAKKKIREQYEL